MPGSITEAQLSCYDLSLVHPSTAIVVWAVGSGIVVVYLLHVAHEETQLINYRAKESVESKERIHEATRMGLKSKELTNAQQTLDLVQSREMLVHDLTPP